MKKPSSGLGVVLWVAGGLVGLYLLGFALVVLDNATTQFISGAPQPVVDIIAHAYAPFVNWLFWLFPP